MPTTDIDALEQALLAAAKAASAAHREKDQALRAYNGTAMLVKGKVARGIAPDRSPESKRAYETAKAAYARAARTKNLACEALEKAGGSPASVIRGITTRTLAARAKGSSTESSPYSPLSRHRFLLDVTQEKFNRDAADRLRRHNAIETRDTGFGASGGGFVAPSFWSDYWSDVSRESATIRQAMVNVTLPPYGGIGYLPKWDAGSSVSVLGLTFGVNDSVVEADATPVSSEYVTAELVTLASEWTISRQLFERCDPVAEVSFGQDLINAYEAALSDNLVNGDGSTGNHVGLTNVAGSGTYDGSGVSTATDFLATMAAALSQYYSTRKALATHVVLHPSQYLFIASGVTTAGAPLLSQGGVPAAGVGADPTWSAGNLLGCKVLLTESIDESVAALWRPVDSVFAGKPVTFAFQGVRSSALETRLQLYGVSQSFMHRIPESILQITGLGSGF